MSEKFDPLKKLLKGPGVRKSLSLMLTLAIVAAVPLTVFVAMQQQEFRQRAGGPPATPPSPIAVTLELSPSSGNNVINVPFDVKMILNGGTNNIIGADVTIFYNKDILEITKTQSGKIFNDELINKIDNTAGTFRFAAVNTLQNQINGSINMATITFKGKTTGDANVYFQKNAQITALGMKDALPVSDVMNGMYKISLTPVTTLTPTISVIPTCIPRPACLDLTPACTIAEPAGGWCPLTPTPTASISTLPVCTQSNIPPQDGFAPIKETLYGSGKAGDPDSGIVGYQWDFENTGLWDPNISIGPVVHVYENQGIFNPKYRILGANKQWSQTCNYPYKILAKTPGDANGDGSVDILDYNIWRNEFLGISTTKQSDFNNDGIVDILDFTIWRNAVLVPPTISGTPVPAKSSKRVFITSLAYDGNLGGLVGADAKCQTRADAAKLDGTWKAWLSDDNTSASSRLTHNDGDYIRIDGVIVANSWSDLITGSLLSAINITELNTVNNNSWVWTNTFKDGTIRQASGSSCNNWSGNSSGGATGDSTRKDSGWTDYGAIACIHLQPLYCFEQ